MTFAALFRAAQIALIGADRRGVRLWQRIDLERILVRAVVTPRMHGIHHADVRDLESSNWSSFPSCWDVLHGTCRFDVPQPFREQKEDWATLPPRTRD